MSKKYLFGAEVNKIQETLFRASLQRQVVGGSRLLHVFGEEAAQYAIKKYRLSKDDVLIKAGGNFRFLFNNSADAEEFGTTLSNAYQRLLNAPMTVAAPQPIAEPVAEHFSQANSALGKDLNERKRSQSGQGDLPHAPTTAFCQSSGVGLAERHEPLSKAEGESEPEYMSAFAFKMKEVGHRTKTSKISTTTDPDDNSFLGLISKKLPTPYNRWNWADKPEDVAAYDGMRNNVAYLVADGNNMGRLFDSCCTPKQLRELSEALEDAVREAIAAPLPALVRRLYDVETDAEFDQMDITPELPLLPLILAGDDIFVMLPAPYALAFARCFCLAFEKAMRKHDIVQELMKQDKCPGDESLEDKCRSRKSGPPRMSAAVAFCKASYPYHLAHRYGERLLGEQAKKVSKRVGRDGGQWYSAVAFDLIVGSELVPQTRLGGNYRSGLTVYWAVGKEEEGSASEITGLARAAAVDLNKLLSQRLALRELPAKRRNELRELFNSGLLRGKKVSDDNLKKWTAQFRQMRQRMKDTNPEAKQHKLLDQALQDLGDDAVDLTKNPAAWLEVNRARRMYKAQGLMDLINIWPYAQSLNERRVEYE